MSAGRTTAACLLVAALGAATWGVASRRAAATSAPEASAAPAVAASVAARPEPVPAPREEGAGGVAEVVASAPAPAVPASAAPALLPAAETMAEARLHGDRRAPPIDPPEPAAPRAEPWQLADPAAYQARERRLAREVDARFAAAAQARLGEQRAALQELQARGASPQDLAQAEDKIRHLEAAQQAAIASGAAP